jgi:hypothetical protein
MGKLKPNQINILGGLVVTEIPVLFQTDMVKAILEDRKTQTRRGFNQPYYLTNSTQSFKGMGFINGNPNQFAASIGSENFSTLFKCKYGKPGDLIWVRETWSKIEARIIYQAEGDLSEVLEEHGLDKMRWKPSIHMPKSAARIWLMVESISCERVQDISREDAIAEGIKKTKSTLPDKKEAWSNYSLEEDDSPYYFNPKHSFQSLWESINGKKSWNSNPWVWVIKFRVLSKTGYPSIPTIQENYLQITGK